MQVIEKKKIADETWVGIWRIDESPEWLRSQLMLNEQENLLIDSLKNPNRKLQWLSSRVLLRSMMETDQFIHLENDLNGKPVVHNFDINLSISHSENLSALLLSRKYEVGIDIEKISPKIDRIAYKFLSPVELACIDEKNRLAHLYIFWCAKEAMYKLYGKKQLDFREHLHVKPFSYKESGTIKGFIQKNDYSQELPIYFEKIGDYMTAYTFSPSSGFTR